MTIRDPTNSVLRHKEVLGKGGQEVESVVLRHARDHCPPGPEINALVLESHQRNRHHQDTALNTHNEVANAREGRDRGEASEPPLPVGKQQWCTSGPELLWQLLRLCQYLWHPLKGHEASLRLAVGWKGHEGVPLGALATGEVIVRHKAQHLVAAPLQAPQSEVLEHTAKGHAGIGLIK